IQPLFSGITELEFWARVAGQSEINPHEIVRETFSQILTAGERDLDIPSYSREDAWKRFLFNGFEPNIQVTTGTYNWKFRGQLPEIKSATAPSAKNLEVVFYRDAKVDDGRYANNGWMQELPDPITRITWDNAVLISRKTASELQVQNGDVVEISLNGKRVSGPIWIQPGMAD